MEAEEPRWWAGYALLIKVINTATYLSPRSGELQRSPLFCSCLIQSGLISFSPRYWPGPSRGSLHLAQVLAPMKSPTV